MGTEGLVLVFLLVVDREKREFLRGVSPIWPFRLAHDYFVSLSESPGVATILLLILLKRAGVYICISTGRNCFRFGWLVMLGILGK